jgi:hypothetical protein
MTWLFLAACILLLYLTHEMRLNDLAKTDQELKSSVQRILDDLAFLKRQVKEIETHLNIQKPVQKNDSQPLV